MDTISIRQLRTFAAVAQYKSFSLAAAALNLSQPALTQHVQQLESYLRVTLFDRNPRSVELTRQGVHFFELVERLLRDFDFMVNDAKALVEHRHGTVRIACPASMTAQLVIPSVRDLRKDHPGITVSTREIDEPNVQEYVRNGQVDFAMTGTWMPSGDLTFSELFRDRACVLLSSGHPFTNKNRLTFADLQDQPFIRAPNGTAAETLTVRAEAMTGHNLKTACEVSQLMSTAAMVEEGIGIAILPALSCATVRRFGVTAKALEAPDLWRSCGFVTSLRRTLSPTAKLLMRFIEHHIKSLPVAFPEGIEIADLRDVERGPATPDRPGLSVGSSG